MTRLDELRLMAKVARLYYERGLTQPAIAAQLCLSQSTVSRLLKRAEREEIVRITVSSPRGAYPELEDALQGRYGMKDVIVADCDADSSADALRAIGAAAAYYLETTLDRNEVVGISCWSETLLAMVDALPSLNRGSGVRVVQILGGIGNPGAEVHATHLTHRLATRLRAEATFLPAPGILASPAARDAIYADAFVQEALRLFDQVTLALVGIGAVEPSHALAQSGNVFSAAELDGLRALNAAGDLCLRFFDAGGVKTITPLDERVIGMTLEQLRRVRRVVAVAGGQRKTEAILGALRGGWINVLITDRFTARRLIDQAAPLP